MKSKDMIIIKKISEYCKDIQKIVTCTRFEDFVENITVNRATAMTLQQIGELSKKLSDDIKLRFNDIKWEDIRGLRNRIAHDYEGIDWNIVWEAVEKDVPELLDYTQKILTNINQEEAR